MLWDSLFSRRREGSVWREQKVLFQGWRVTLRGGNKGNSIFM